MLAGILWSFFLLLKGSKRVLGTQFAAFYWRALEGFVRVVFGHDLCLIVVGITVWLNILVPISILLIPSCKVIIARCKTLSLRTQARIWALYQWRYS